MLIYSTVALYFDWTYPSIELKTSGKDVVVHLETLADYPTHIDRIVIAESDRPDAIVFEATSQNHAAIHRFVIHAGNNDVALLHPYGGTYKVVIPDGRSFVLVRDDSYRITVCKSRRCSSARLSIK